MLRNGRGYDTLGLVRLLRVQQCDVGLFSVKRTVVVPICISRTSRFESLARSEVMLPEYGSNKYRARLEKMAVSIE